jgi:hypothetical protein
MNWNLWKRWKERRRQKQLLESQSELMQTWRWLERLFQRGVLTFDAKNRRLFITQPMAVLMLNNGAEGWVNSIRNIYQYTYLKQSQKAWEQFMRDEELRAVREAIAAAKAAGEKPLTRQDIERIRRSRRAEIMDSDMTPPKVEPFEFFIIPDSRQPKVEPIAVGYYDPESGEMDVATWDEVKPMLRKQ